MKANELMLGDFVTFNECINPDTRIIPIEIVGIGFQCKGGENECLVRIGGDEVCDIIEIDDEIVGIPLTVEILEKNFLNANDGVVWFPCEWGLHCESRNQEDVMFSGIFRFVHQLQHALKLANISKQIEL